MIPDTPPSPSHTAWAHRPSASTAAAAQDARAQQPDAPRAPLATPRTLPPQWLVRSAEFLEEADALHLLTSSHALYQARLGTPDPFLRAVFLAQAQQPRAPQKLQDVTANAIVARNFRAAAQRTLRDLIETMPVRFRTEPRLSATLLAATLLHWKGDLGGTERVARYGLALGGAPEDVTLCRELLASALLAAGRHDEAVEVAARTLDGAGHIRSLAGLIGERFEDVLAMPDVTPINQALARLGLAARTRDDSAADREALARLHEQTVQAFSSQGDFVAARVRDMDAAAREIGTLMAAALGSDDVQAGVLGVCATVLAGYFAPLAGHPGWPGLRRALYLEPAQLASVPFTIDDVCALVAEKMLRDKAFALESSLAAGVPGCAVEACKVLLVLRRFEAVEAVACWARQMDPVNAPHLDALRVVAFQRSGLQERALDLCLDDPAWAREITQRHALLAGDFEAVLTDPDAEPAYRAMARLGQATAVQAAGGMAAGEHPTLANLLAAFDREFPEHHPLCRAMIGDFASVVAHLEPVRHRLLDGISTAEFLNFCDCLGSSFFAGMEGHAGWNAYRRAIFMTPQQLATVELRIPEDILRHGQALDGPALAATQPSDLPQFEPSGHQHGRFPRAVRRLDPAEPAGEADGSWRRGHLHPCLGSRLRGF